MNGNKTTTWTGIGAAFFTALTILAGLPYQLGELATIIPPEWKPYIVGASLVAAFMLRVWNSVAQAGTGEVKQLENRVNETIDAVNNIKP